MYVRIRRISSAVLAILLSLMLLVASLGVWAQRAVLNQSVFAQNTEKILESPEVLSAISAYVVDETFQAVPRPSGSGGALLGELLRGAIERQVSRVLASDVVQKEVVQAMVATHGQFVDVLESEADEIVFDLGPVIKAVATGLVGEGVLPASGLTGTGIGQVYIYSGESSPSVKQDVENAQRAVSVFQQGLLLVFLLIPVVGAVVVVSASRKLSGARNMSVALLVASSLGLVILRIAQTYLPNIVDGAANKLATVQIIGVMTQGFMWFLIASWVVAALGIVFTMRQGALLQSLLGKSKNRV
jgi:hypothetical protein